MDVVATVRTVNPLDSNPQNYRWASLTFILYANIGRILLKSGNMTFIVAVSDDEEIINRHWDYLNKTLLVTAQQIDEDGTGEEVVHYMISKST